MTSRERLEAWLLPLGAPLLALTTGLAPPAPGTVPTIPLGAAALVAASGLVVRYRDRTGRALATAGFALVVVALRDALLGSPTFTFLVLAALAGVLLRLWDREESEDATAVLVRDARVRFEFATAALSALGLWFLVVVGRAGAAPWGPIAVAVSFPLAGWYAGRWMSRRGRALRWITLALAVAALAAAGGAVVGGYFRWAASALALPIAFVLVTTPPRRDETFRWLPDLDHPANLLVVTFAFLSALGGFLLMLPVCASGGHAIRPLDALFTSTSAVCVTGLIVLDTPNAFSLVGQAVLLLLIQVGGLGIMTFSTAALGMLGRRLSVRHESAVAGLVGGDNRRDIFRILRATLVLTITIEVAGAAVLALLFRFAGDSAAHAAWRGLFTSISAFCNAGFALQTDSLVGYRGNPLVLHTVGLLIITGGLSPLVLTSLPAVLRRRRAALRVKLALATSGVLLVIGFVLFALLEWNGPAFAGLSVLDRLHNAWFQSVTARTAGFNSVDLAQFGDAATTLMMLLMFIGGAPGGTAGGIKVTTLAVLLFGVIAGLRGRDEPEVLGRRISRATFQRATAILVLGLVAVIGGVLALQATSAVPYRMGAFEVVSALATVGLSLGATPLLDATGHVLLILCMLAGRVGPLAAFVFFLDRHSGGAWEFPAEDVEVG